MVHSCSTLWDGKKMDKPTLSSRAIRIGEFSLDTRTGELSGAGRKLQLTVQPLQVLLVLLEHPGELVTRDELVKRVWPADTFVDFDHGLKDSADAPRFIETLPRRGYRLIAPVDAMPEAAGQGPLTAAEPIPVEPAATEAPQVLVADSDKGLSVPQAAPRRKRRILYPALGVAAVACLAFVIVFAARGTFQKLLNRFRPARTEIESLAVLPLQNLSVNPEESYFADGMTDALIT